MNEELEQLRKDLLKYKQLFLALESHVYDMQICLNQVMSSIDEALDSDQPVSGAV